MPNYESGGKVYLLFIAVVLGIALFLAVTFYRSFLDRKLPKLLSSNYETSLRGSIISADGFSVATSQKLYKATLDTRHLDPNKKELFIKLYSLYTGSDPKKVAKQLKKVGSVTLSYEITAKEAAHLKELARTLYRQKVFVPFSDPKTGALTTQGLSIIQSGERRIYLAGDSLAPAIGYVKKIEDAAITKTSGVKGIEQVYETALSTSADEIIKGPRDLSNTIILSKEAEISRRIDGYDVVLNIPLKLQKLAEQLASSEADEQKAKEVVFAVMEARSGRILSLASSKRYNPQSITRNDYSALNSTASEYAYEMGSVIKPFVFATLLGSGKISLDERVKTFGGRYKLGSRTITDSHATDYLSAAEVIVQSSNIGMIQLAEKMSSEQMLAGLMSFGFGSKTGVDLSYEQKGRLPSARDLNNRVYKATVSYGYGLQATFMQLLTAYNAITNGGVLISPKIASHLSKDGAKYRAGDDPTAVRVISKMTSAQMQQILNRVVSSDTGTGKKARINGLNLGGKTGTAHIAAAGGYSDKRYNASFFGYASDGKNAYTIGVLVREPGRGYPFYYASQSALPVFKKVVELLVDNRYLMPVLAD